MHFIINKEIINTTLTFYENNTVYANEERPTTAIARDMIVKGRVKV